jgi:malate dehydrogenase
MTTVAIVGAGEIAGSTAHSLAGSDRVGRVLFIDPVRSAAIGKALDLRQAGAIDGTHTRLEGTDDTTRVTGCDVCVIADRFGAGGEWCGEEGLALVRQLISYAGRVPIVFAGAFQVDLLAAAAEELAVHPRRLLGSAAGAFASAAAAIVATEANSSARQVKVTVLGTPPAGLVIPWSEASIDGYGVEQMLAPVQLTRVQARTAVLWPPGPYVLGTAAARVVTAILSSSRQSFCVLTQLGGEFGVRHRVGCLPVRLGPRGIVETRVPELTIRERVQVQTALGG